MDRFKISFYVLLIGLLAFAGLWLMERRNTAHIRSLYKGQIDQIKASKDSIITAKMNENEILRNTIKDRETKIDLHQARFDSLSEEKEKIRTIYIEKVEAVESFTTEELEDYWRNEF
jgi:hypothetical protein